MNCYDPVVRRFAARTFSTLLCCILIVLRPFSSLGGPAAFLALTFRELAFPVRLHLTSQLEVTVLSLLGALLSIVLSALANYLVHLAPPNSVLSRTIRPLFILVMSFIAGFLQSRLPRLRASMRIGVVIAIWMLTSKVPSEDIIQNALNYLWIVLVSSISALVAALLFLTSSTPQFADAVANCFQQLHECLAFNMSNRWTDDQATLTSNSDHSERLLGRSIELCSTYSQAAFDLRIGRVDIKRLKPLVSSIEHIRRELAWGMSTPKSYPPSESQQNMMLSLQSQSHILGQSILQALSAIQRVVKASFKPGFRRESLVSEKDVLVAAEADLEGARNIARNQLKEACAEMEFDVWEESSRAMVPQSVLDACLCMISLLQMTHEVRHALHVSKKIAHLYEDSSPRLWYPRLSWAWLGVESSSLIQDEQNYYVGEDSGRGLMTDLSQTEAMQGLFEQNEEPELKPSVPTYLLAYWWKRPTILKIRLRISRLLRAIQHSQHIQYGLKLSGGLMVMGIPAFLPTDSAGYHWFRTFRGQWMLISYVWVLETTSGGTWRVGYLRLLGTILGAIYAYVTWAICRTNPYGLVAMVTLVEIPISWVCLKTTFPSLGTVTYITLPPLVFAQYFSPTESVIRLSFYRVLLIGIGILAALLINSLIFRRNSRVLFLDNTSRALGYLDELYLACSRDLLGNSPASRHDHHKALALELSVRNALQRMSNLLIIMSDELSLIPKPMKKYNQVVSTLQKLLDTLIGLRKIREHIPRQETVLPLVNERRELMSCVCVCLFACENVYNTRQPLPQFLPSAREALRQLELSVSQRLFRHHHNRKNDTMVIYALAEIDILRKMVETIEELLGISRHLFGTAEWFAKTPDTTMMMISQQEDRSRAASPTPMP